MNKLGRMQKGLVKRVVIAVVVVAAAGVVWFMTDQWLGTASEQHQQIEATTSQNSAELQALKTKLEQADAAEKRYADIQAKRSNYELSTKNETLVQHLRDSKARYRLSNTKLNLVPEAFATQAELSNPSFNVSLREGITVESEGISDLHIFSFLQDLIDNSEGFVRITSLEIQRKADLMPTVIAQLQAGQNVPTVTAKIQYTLIGIQPKDTPITTDNATSGLPSAPGGAQ